VRIGAVMIGVVGAFMKRVYQLFVVRAISRYHCSWERADTYTADERSTKPHTNTISDGPHHTKSGVTLTFAQTYHPEIVIILLILLLLLVVDFDNCNLFGLTKKENRS